MRQRRAARVRRRGLTVFVAATLDSLFLGHAILALDRRAHDAERARRRAQAELELSMSDGGPVACVCYVCVLWRIGQQQRGWNRLKPWAVRCIEKSAPAVRVR